MPRLHVLERLAVVRITTLHCIKPSDWRGERGTTRARRREKRHNRSWHARYLPHGQTEVAWCVARPAGRHGHRVSGRRQKLGRPLTCSRRTKGTRARELYLSRFKKHCELHRISKINTSIGKGARFRDRTECRNGHPFQEITYTFPQTGGVDPATTRARPSSVRGSGSQSNPIPEGGRHDRQHH
jgi:hypothetical protein